MVSARRHHSLIVLTSVVNLYLTLHPSVSKLVFFISLKRFVFVSDFFIMVLIHYPVGYFDSIVVRSFLFFPTIIDFLDLLAYMTWIAVHDMDGCPCTELVNPQLIVGFVESFLNLCLFGPS